MMRKYSLHNHAIIVEWLKQRVLKTKKCNIFEYIEEIPEILSKIKEYEFSVDPNLPIDLICVEKKPEKDPESGKVKNFPYYTIFLVISTKSIPDLLENRILFYRFYLSRIISTKRLKIVLVAPAYTQKINEKFLKGNGIGFWKFVGRDKDPEEVHPPISLRDQMAKEFWESEPERKDIPLFFDRYVHDAVGAIAGIRPEQFGKRYIDRKVMAKIFDLKNISYHKELVIFINEQLTEKGDEYEFASEVFAALWEKHIGLPYSNFLKVFEPGLQHIFAETRENGRIYRDHYLHQFQVFLLGIPIMDNLYKFFSQKYKEPALSWLIASSFHDISYPIQLYDEWSEKFFRDAFKIPRSPGTLELKSNFVDHSFLSCMGYLIDWLCSVHLCRQLKSNWLDEENDLVQFFYKEITTIKNHGVLSSISLLKMIQSPSNKKKLCKKLGCKFQTALKDIFLPCVLSITLHESKIWSKLRKEKATDKSPKVLSTLKFVDDPLSFLLIFCDCVQEWGRPSKFQEDEKIEKWKRFYLKEFVLDSTRVNITLWTPKYTKGEKFFRDKQDELRELQNFLQPPPSVDFTIRLRDKDDKGEDFTMLSSHN